MKGITQLAHIALKVKDVGKSLDFYVNKMGFPEMFRLEREGRLWIVYLRVTDDQYLELFPEGVGDRAAGIGLLALIGFCETRLDHGDEVGHRVLDGVADEDDPFLEQAREDVVRALAAVRLFDDHGNEIVLWIIHSSLPPVTSGEGSVSRSPPPDSTGGDPVGVPCTNGTRLPAASKVLLLNAQLAPQMMLPASGPLPAMPETACLPRGCIVVAPVEGQGGLSTYLLHRALKIGGDRYNGRLKPWDMPMDGFLALTLRRKIRDKMGKRVKAWVSGGAPLNPEVGVFFQSLGITFLQGYGETLAGSGDPVTPETVFRWASTSKGVAATMVAKLAEQGKINLNAPVANYAPDLKLPAGNEYKATVGDLLSHRLGLYRNAYDNRLEEGQDPSFLRSSLAELSATCAPGTCWSYQNVAYDASSEMVSRITRLPYEQAVKRTLFNPIGMTSGSVSMTGLQGNRSWARPHPGHRWSWSGNSGSGRSRVFSVRKRSQRGDSPRSTTGAPRAVPHTRHAASLGGASVGLVPGVGPINTGLAAS
jgi:CubicO group peptidase (beta-lactamase class C family)/catechol 2,3-dioxygenase-like lactoylglutathione lyase family enzyme